ncbi:MAG: Hsp33 family molecular chaperone HslO, partial [Erysipelotrichaceae bacterium]
EEKIIIQINGGGPIGTIMVDAKSNGEVRGFVGDPHQYMTYNDTKKLAVGIAVGKEGTLKVTKDLAMKDSFGGTVALQTGEIGDDFAYYFAMSEQRPSVVALGVLVSKENTILASGGLLIQMLPDATEEDIQISEQLLKKLKPITTYLSDGLTLEQILDECYDDINILEKIDINGYCNCGKEKFKRVLTTLTSEERLTMINEDHGCECVCQFCGKKYQFSESELIDLNNFVERYKK